MVPQNKIDLAHKHLLAPKQKRDILSALQTGNGVVIRPTKNTIWQWNWNNSWKYRHSDASERFAGKGLHVDRNRPTRLLDVYVPGSSGVLTSIQWCHHHSSDPGQKVPLGGKKKKFKKIKKGGRIGEKPSWYPTNSGLEQDSGARKTIKFVNKPLSNFDLLNYARSLGIKMFKGVFSRDNLPKKISRECGIANLDDKIGAGTHWVCCRHIDDYWEHFDSSGLAMPSDIIKYVLTSGKQIVYSGEEIQERDSVLCRYWCLYYLLERQSGRSFLDVIHNPRPERESRIHQEILYGNNLYNGTKLLCETGKSLNYMKELKMADSCWNANMQSCHH